MEGTRFDVMLTHETVVTSIMHGHAYTRDDVIDCPLLLSVSEIADSLLNDR